MKFLRLNARGFMLRTALLLSASLALAACAPFQPYPETVSTDYYVVQPGDNLHSIAFVLQTTPEALRAQNPWANSATLSAGTRLVIPQDSTTGALASPRSDGSPAQPARGDYIWPLRHYEVSSRYGRRWGRFHRGIDLHAPRGTPIYAVADGKVRLAARDGAFGNKVVIDHGKGVETVYAHNLRNLVKPGQWVEQGEVIATVGQTGNATGYHLHFEFRRNGRALNPVRQIQVAQE